MRRSGATDCTRANALERVKDAERLGIAVRCLQRLVEGAIDCRTRSSLCFCPPRIVVIS